MPAGPESFLDKRYGTLITDGATERAFSTSVIAGGSSSITIKPHGGFVAIFK